MHDCREGVPGYESCSYYEKTHNFTSIGGKLVYKREVHRFLMGWKISKIILKPYDGW